MGIRTMRYRLALDLGTTSIGWAMLRLRETDGADTPCAVIRAGVRIFSNGREPAPPGEQGESLAVTRRTARAMRRNRDRKLKRKAQLMATLIETGFFPADDSARKALDVLDPYELRATGLTNPLTPEQFGRAIFHLNQRRGFLSNRKTDKKDNESGALKAAIRRVRETLVAQDCITIGQWLAKQHKNRAPIRARYRELRVQKPDGKFRTDKSYDLYIDRAMIRHEFDELWKAQAGFAPALYTEAKRERIAGVIFHQRPLKPVKPGRCTFLPDQERAPQAMPSTQRLRIYQELNHLAILGEDGFEHSLTKAQRDAVAKLLFESATVTFQKIATKLKLGGRVRFNLEDAKRDRLQGDKTGVLLSKPDFFGPTWHEYSLARQDEIVGKLLKEDNEEQLIGWLSNEFPIDEPRAERIANASLPEGYSRLGAEATRRILEKLIEDVVPYSTAAKNAGFHHSVLSHAQETGEILPSLPYYGEYLQRHVGFGSGEPTDSPEKRYGRIANPTVHIGLNEVRKVVNALIARYGHPSQIIVEVTRDLKNGKARRDEIRKQQAENQKRNKRFETDIKAIVPGSVQKRDLTKMKLWEELNPQNVMERRCPYTGENISINMLLSEAVEIEHILPFSRTLDDSLNNKTVCLLRANRYKKNRTPFEAFGESKDGFDYAKILERVSTMNAAKRKRFAPDGLEKWLKEDRDFVARALNDTAYLSRVAREYLSLVCPYQQVIAIPGRLTGMLRGKLGLNDILGLSGEKNRNDHRHHAVDACVIGITDRALLSRFAKASASARESALNKLIDEMPEPFANYRAHVQRAVQAIVVSHKPDHSHEGRMHNDTAYGLLGDGLVAYTKHIDGQKLREPERLNVIEMAEPSAVARHGVLPDGKPRPYKGYKGDSNYCIEIVRNDHGKWEGEVISTFQAYQVVRSGGIAKLRDKRKSVSGKPLVMRLIVNDFVTLTRDNSRVLMRVATISGNGQIFMARPHEANVDARNRNKSDDFSYTSKMAGSLQTAQGRQTTVSPIGLIERN